MTGFVVPKSRVKLWQIADTKQLPVSITHNEALAWWGFAAAKSLGYGGPEWRIRKIYIEFENVVDPEDPVSIPVVTAMDPADGREYYAGLSVSPSRDYLRVDLLTTPLISPEEGYEEYFSQGEGNLLGIYAQTADSVGRNGKEFSAEANSKVCGSAVVVAPVESDDSRDIVVARAYFTEQGQQLKADGLQIGISWEIPFILPQ